MIGGLAALMLLTHWMALWLVAGLVLAAAFTLPGRKGAVIVIAVIPLLALAAWGAWNTRVCGYLLGGAKTMFQAHLLTLDPTTSSARILAEHAARLCRRIAAQARHELAQSNRRRLFLSRLPGTCRGLLHRPAACLRRRETTRSCHALAIMFAAVMLGMGFIGLPEKTEDDNALYFVLAPAMGIFGAAMLAVLWARLQGSSASHFWARLGFGVIAIIISALPMAAELPAHVKEGLMLRGRIRPHWPPYVPDRITFVRRLLEPDEIVFADVPWFVAWYADVPAVWLPVKRSDFTAMVAQAEVERQPRRWHRRHTSQRPPQSSSRSLRRSVSRMARPHLPRPHARARSRFPPASRVQIQAPYPARRLTRRAKGKHQTAGDLLHGQGTHAEELTPGHIESWHWQP